MQAAPRRSARAGRQPLPFAFRSRGSNCRPIYPDDDTIAHVKFTLNADQAMKAFGAAPLERVHILTMVLRSDGLWRAWGLSENYFPPRPK